jgi:hypothetical protein
MALSRIPPWRSSTVLFIRFAISTRRAEFISKLRSKNSLHHKRGRGFGERRRGRRSARNYSRTSVQSHDALQASKLPSYVGIERVWSTALKLVKQQEPAIRAVAAVLMERGRLDAWEFSALMREVGVRQCCTRISI